MKTNMFASVIEKYKSQFIPVEEKNIRITIDGNIAIKVNNEYRAINKEDEITSYAEEMCFDFPVWSINKLYNKVVVGDKVVTSDISDRYQPGILIGYISYIEEDSNNLTKSGYITPAVDFEHLSEVLVITELKQTID